jgi:3',5'-cyclic-AMP phosphodiesterase
LPPYLLMQISDVHLTPGDPQSRDSLVAALRLLREASPRPDVLLMTGDLADAGDGPTYALARDLLGECAAALGATLVCLPGNHDDRAAFREHLLGTPPGDSPVNQVRWHVGLRIIALDSTVPGEGSGLLAPSTLEYLSAELATAAPDGTVLALHHPPVTSPVGPISGIRLRNPGDLQDALAGSDVRLIVCGHYHHEEAGSLGPVPVWVGPAIAYRADPASTEKVRRVPVSAISRIDLTPAGFTATVIPVRGPGGAGAPATIFGNNVELSGERDSCEGLVNDRRR